MWQARFLAAKMIPMSQSTNKVSAVIVGAGIVGNSLAYHLARLGWRDIVLVDKGPMPNPGGSTGHASNFIFPVDYSKMMTDLTDRQLGAVQGAWRLHRKRRASRSPAPKQRCQELRRRASAAKAWGFAHELLSPAGVAELVPTSTESCHTGGSLPPDRRRGRFAAGGNASCASRHADGRARGAGEHRGPRYRARLRRAGRVRGVRTTTG